MKNKIKEFQKYYDNGVLCAEVVNTMEEFYQLYLKSGIPGREFFRYCSRLDKNILDLCGAAVDFEHRKYGIGGNSGQIRLFEYENFNLSYIVGNQNKVHHNLFYIAGINQLHCRNDVFSLSACTIPFSEFSIDNNAEEMYFQVSTLVPEEYINMYAFYNSLHKNLNSTNMVVQVNNLSKAFLNARMRKLKSAILTIQEHLDRGELHNPY